MGYADREIATCIYVLISINQTLLTHFNRILLISKETKMPPFFAIFFLNNGINEIS